MKISTPLQSVLLFGLFLTVALIGGAGTLISVGCVPVFQPASALVLSVLFVVHATFRRPKGYDTLLAAVACALAAFLWHIYEEPLIRSLPSTLAAFVDVIVSALLWSFYLNGNGYRNGDQVNPMVSE
jgi:MFS superfamily sulfate permease-like transporter